MQYNGLYLVALLMFVVSEGGQWIANAQTHGVYREQYNNISGSTLADLLTAPAYPNTPSSTTILTNGFETPVNVADNYGQRLRAFLVPPITGFYTFWIASDDQSVLSLSEDENPANKREIAGVAGWTDAREWNKEISQISLPVSLQAGKHYYIEAIMKEGYGGDHLSVRWQLPNGMVDEPITPDYLIPINIPINPPIITRQPPNSVVNEGQIFVIGVDISNLDKVGYQWYRSGFPIVGATNAFFTNQSVSMSENGVRFSCSITNTLGSTNTDEALLTVIPDKTPPVPISAYNIGDKKIMVVFSEPIYPLDSASSFKINNEVSVLSISSNADPRIIALNTTPLKYRSSYTISFKNIIDRSGASNLLPPSTQFSFITLEFSPQNIGGAAAEGAIEPTEDGFKISAAGSDIGGGLDQFLFNYQERLGNFDFRLQIESIEGDTWAKAGLMLRRNLSSSSPYAAILSTPNIGGCVFQYRTTTNSSSVSVGNFPVNYPQTWLRLKREGDLVSGFAGYDGNRVAAVC